MANFVISTDATSDLSVKYLAEKDVACISMLYNIAGNDYWFGNGEEGLAYPDFYEMMRQEKMPKTAQITPQNAEEHFEKFLKEGKDVLHVAFSSALSGSCDNAAAAAKTLSEKYPERKVIVVNSLCASLGEGLYVDYAVECRNKGMSIEETAAFLEEHKQNLCHYFTVDDLHHLHRGGRVSRFTAIVGTILKIKPGLHVDEQGRLIPIAKLKGRRKALEWLVERMKDKVQDTAPQRVFISHGDCPEDAEFVAELIRTAFGFTDITIDYIGPVVGAHSGPGTVALFFMGGNRTETK